MPGDGVWWAEEEEAPTLLGSQITIYGRCASMQLHACTWPVCPTIPMHSCCFRLPAAQRWRPSHASRQLLSLCVQPCYMLVYGGVGALAQGTNCSCPRSALRIMGGLLNGPHTFGSAPDGGFCASLHDGGGGMPATARYYGALLRNKAASVYSSLATILHVSHCVQCRCACIEASMCFTVAHIVQSGRAW